MDSPVCNILSLFSGYAGLDIGLSRGLERVGIASRVVAHVEREAYAAAVLVERMEQARLDPAPVWTDVTTFDGAPFRGLVECVVAGWPCPPHSSAARGRNREDDGWESTASIIRAVRPRMVFLENVAEARASLEFILENLAALGFDAEWVCTDWTPDGHARDRLYVLAYAYGQSKPPCTFDAEMAGVCTVSGRDWRAIVGERLGVDDGDGVRVDRYRLLGNGAHPEQAAVAFCELWRRFHEG